MVNIPEAVVILGFHKNDPYLIDFCELIRNNILIETAMLFLLKY